MTELLAAVIGALLAGALQLVDRVFERRRRRESTLVAIAAEVKAIVSLIRHQQYFEEFSKLATKIRAGSWDGNSLIIDIRSDYFSAFSALSLDLGLLKPGHVAKIVAFNSYCKSAIDSTRPDGPMASTTDKSDVASNILGVEGTLAALLLIGDEIISFPRRQLPDALVA